MLVSAVRSLVGSTMSEPERPLPALIPHLRPGPGEPAAAWPP